jgi:hypothetical protein
MENEYSVNEVNNKTMENEKSVNEESQKVMEKYNENTQAIPIAVVDEVMELIEEAKALMKPYVRALTPEQRRAALKMGEKTLSFVEHALELAVINPDLQPKFLNITTFKGNLDDAKNLMPLFITVQQLEEELDDTKMVAGGDAYKDALAFYNSVKYQAEQDIPGAKAVYDILKVRFPRGKHNTPE